MNDVLSRFQARLDELGITARVGPTTAAPHGIRRGTIKLARGASAQDYVLLYGSAVAFTDIAKAGVADRPALIFTTFTAPKTADTLRRSGVQYLDSAGNAWITFGDVLVDVRGRPRPDREPAPQRPVRNLFSTVRAQIIFALLAWPHLWTAPRRDIADAAGVSLGQAHNTMILLAEAGYEDDQARPRQTPLLDLWTAAFPTGLAAKLTLATFHGDPDKMARRGAVFISGEKAADDLLRPATLTVYVKELDPRLPIENRWRADGRPNIFVRRKFWNAPDQEDPPTGPTIAPWPLVYADLLASDDPRVRGTAYEWKDRHAPST